MRRASSFLALCALAACAPPQTSTQQLESEVRQLRAEQDRQARQLELLENRIVLAEDSARLARQALVGVGAHQSVRIAPDGSSAVESIPSATAEPDEPGDGSDANAPRPIVHAVGREAPPPNQPPIVVHDDDRLPVVPVPDAPPATPSPGAHPTRGPDEHDIPAMPSSPATAPPESMLTPAATPGVSSARDARAAPAYEQALALARGGRCREAVDAFSQFLVRWPDHPFADNAMYWRGECMLSGGDVRRAASEFEGLLARFPVGNKAPDALYKLVVCYRRLGDESRARGYATRLLREFPRSEVAARLRAERTP